MVDRNGWQDVKTVDRTLRWWTGTAGRTLKRLTGR